jgi:hypothetical protein
MIQKSAEEPAGSAVPTNNPGVRAIYGSVDAFDALNNPEHPVADVGIRQRPEAKA